MTDKSLDKLQAAFQLWRGSKQRRSEGTPPALLERAKRAAAIHGVGHIARLLGVERKYLTGPQIDRPRTSKAKATLPTFSRIEMDAPRASQPMVEIETPLGRKVRLFSVTPETLDLLSSICRDGGAA